jgi:hypothetical protein
MPDIRYICLSDLHLGADNSLLTRLGSTPGTVNPALPSEVLKGLASCLRELVRHNKGPHRPTLVLNGDALELALAEDNIALMAFERFLEVMFPAKEEPLIDSKIIFNPGNHDHHLWETAREAQYVEFLQGKRRKKAGADLPVPWHTTQLFHPDPVDSALLNAVVGRHPHMTSRGVGVGTVYPNLCLLNADESKCVIFSHGHFIEPIYMLMTTVGDFVFPRRKVPTEIWEIETENFAWIDFFWSTMGRSGEVGRDIEEIYDILLVPDARKRFIRQMARAGGRDWFRSAPKLGEWLGMLSVPFVSKLLGRVVELEKRQPGEVLTPRTRQGLKAYIEGPLAKQFFDHKKPRQTEATSFVFGHTHKPFSASMNFEHFPGGMNVYNSGGWVVDTIDAEPAHGGAIALVDEDMNVVSVRMYNETESNSKCRVRIESVDDGAHAFYKRLAALVDSDQDPWRAFSNVVAANVNTYRENFRARLNMVE